MQIPDDVKQRVMQRLRFGDDSEADVLVPDGNETQTVSEVETYSTSLRLATHCHTSRTLLLS